MKILILLTAIVLSIFVPAFDAFAQASQEPAPPRVVPDEPKIDSDDDLRNAIQNSGGSESQIIINLEDYLKKYPLSARRNEIQNEIYKLSVKLRDRNRAILYAERLIESDPGNIDILTNIVNLLRERNAEGDLSKSLSFADLLIVKFEELIENSLKPGRVSSAQWANRKRLGRASVYLVRGKVHADMKNYSKAKSDLEKSFELGRLAGAALLLGEIAEKQRSFDEALDHYIPAFVLSLMTDEEIDSTAVRNKIGSLYRQKHGSETGLGDRILKVYDNFEKEFAERDAKLEPVNINEGLTDPMTFKLTRLDGSRLDMSSLRGKVIVINFWATWCGPCVTELPLFEKTAEKYREEKNVVFLAISTDEDRELVEPFLKRYNLNLQIVYADYLNHHFAINSIPTTIILDQNGQIAFRQAGYNPREDFVIMLSEMIDKEINRKGRKESKEINRKGRKGKDIDLLNFTMTFF